MSAGLLMIDRDSRSLKQGSLTIHWDEPWNEGYKLVKNFLFNSLRQIIPLMA
jgi:hypothetical protein